jgi:hypothetical protein
VWRASVSERRRRRSDWSERQHLDIRAVVAPASRPSPRRLLQQNLPNPGTERIFETYYSLPVSTWRLTFDYQFVANPAYNQDRGPVSILGTRLHAQF